MPQVWFRLIALACILAVPFSQLPGPSTVEAATTTTDFKLLGDAYVPPNAAWEDSAGVEVALSFKSTWSGSITSIRFYKGAGNDGTHTGYLKDANQVVLASAVFTNETATGWQEAFFSTPVPITSGTQYFASYYAPFGHYAYDSSLLPGPGVDRMAAPLVGRGGAYDYNANPYDQNFSHNFAGYGVDVGFRITDPSIHLNDYAAAPNDQYDAPAPRELGVRFSSNANGTITGLRFYRGSTSAVFSRNGYLKGPDGAVLATVVFSNETLFGWQEASLATPFDVTAGVEYTASYIAEDGVAAFRANVHTSPVTRGPLTAITGVIDYDNDPNDATFTNYTDSYYVDIDFEVSTATNIPLSINIPPRLSFTVSGAPLVSSCNGLSPSAGTTAGPNSLDFGEVLPPSSVRVAQDLNVSTNAGGGFAVSVRASGPLTGPTGTIPHLANPNSNPDDFPAGVSRLGYTVDDNNLGDGDVDRFTAATNQWAGLSTTDARVAYQPSGAPIAHDSCLIFRLDASTDIGAGQLSTQITYTVVPVF